MTITYNEDSKPSFELTSAETETLEQTGYCVSEDCNYCIAKVEDEYAVFKLFNEYEVIKLNWR